jgi:branched-chain amino acid transport system substrate-binding protein
MHQHHRALGGWGAVSVVAAIATAVTFALPAAGAPPAGRAGGGPQPLVVGALLDLTKGWTSLGRASRVALELATADANESLVRIGSRVRVSLRIVDVKGDPALARRELRRLAAQGVRAFVGPQGSSEVRALRRTATSVGALVVSQGSTAHTLAVPGDNVFRFVPDDRREAEALVALVRRQGIRGIVPVWRDDAGNAGLKVSVSSRFGRMGGTVARGVRYGDTTTSFGPTVATVRARVDALRARGVRRVGVYLAGFEEVVALLRTASRDPVLRNVRWYGSDGVALTPRLVADRTAAAFADRVGYPNPTIGLDAQAARNSSGLVRRIRAKLGTKPDALALAAYDALRVIAQAAGAPPTGATTLRQAFVRTASGYSGVTGPIALNSAGDRSFGTFDFWSVCRRGKAFAWNRTWSYLAVGVGRGRIVQRARC